jgi:hypothetical protein
LPANASLSVLAMTFDGLYTLRRRWASSMTTRSHGKLIDVARLAPGEVVGTDDNLGGLERPEMTLPDRRVVGFRLEDATRDEELLGQLLIPLLAEV